VISYLACGVLKPALGYDDSLDVFGVHALGGTWGALASGIFAVTLGSGIESNAQQIMVQLKGIAFAATFSPIVTVVILLGLTAVFGSLRAAEEDEATGLDLSQHSESAYGFAGGSVVVPELGAAAYHPAPSAKPVHTTAN
jgi:ammonium transporter, Amt family